MNVRPLVQPPFRFARTLVKDMIISTRNRRAIIALAMLLLAGAAPPDAVTAPDELTLRRTIALPSDLGTGPVRLAVDPRRRRLFMVTSAAAAVDVIDEDTGSVRARIPAPAEAVPVYRGSDDRLVVLSPGRAATYNGASYERTATAPFAPAVTAATYDGSLQRLYVIATQNGETRLCGIDAVSFAESSTVAAGAHLSALVLDTYRPRIYVIDAAEHRVIVVDRWRGEIVRSWPLASAGANVVALDEDGQRLYVAGADGVTDALDTNTGHEVAELRIAAGTNGLAFDSGSKQLVATANGVLRVYARPGATPSPALGTVPARVPVDAPFAEWLVRSMLSAHPDLRKMGLHTVPPGGRVSAIVANGNATRIGIPTTSGDFAAIASGSTYGPLIDGKYYNMKMPMLDATGTRFGLLVMEIPATSAVDAADAARIAESIRREMSARIPSPAALFGPPPASARE